MKPTKITPLIMARHKAILDLQEQIKPFTPTIAEITVAMGIQAKSHAWKLLRFFEKRGMVISRQTGKGRHYYAIGGTNEAEKKGKASARKNRADEKTRSKPLKGKV